jgi:cbb3-type cytochrome oxidase maturation protein
MLRSTRSGGRRERAGDPDPGLGLAGVAGFLWSLRAALYDDPKGDSRRILDSHWDGAPAASRTDVSGDPPICDRKDPARTRPKA